MGVLKDWKMISGVGLILPGLLMSNMQYNLILDNPGSQKTVL